MGEKPGGESGLGEDEFSLSLGPNGQGEGDEEAKGRWDLATKQPLGDLLKILGGLQEA